MSQQIRRVVLSRLALVLFVGALAADGIVASAFAAQTPQSATTCWGSLKHDRTGVASGEPNLLDYSFYCNTDITAYTIVIDRRPNRTGNIDDFNPGPLVNLPDGTPSSTQAFGCAGTIPGDGFDCNAGKGGVMSAWNTAVGSFDPIDPYCGSSSASSAQTGAKAATSAEPQAHVLLVVTDSTGADDGPFTLAIKNACEKPKPKHRGGHKPSRGTHATPRR
jgi:hypothetical protein